MTSSELGDADPRSARGRWELTTGLTGFNASGVIFPAEGCWQVTGRAGRVALTFVTCVIKATVASGQHGAGALRVVSADCPR